MGGQCGTVNLCKRLQHAGRKACTMQVAFSQCPEPLLDDSITICSCNFELQIAWNIFSFLCARYAIHDTNAADPYGPYPIYTPPLYLCQTYFGPFMWAINHSVVSHLKTKRITCLWTWQVISSYWTAWQGIFFLFGWKYSWYTREGFIWVFV